MIQDLAAFARLAFSHILVLLFASFEENSERNLRTFFFPPVSAYVEEILVCHVIINNISNIISYYIWEKEKVMEKGQVLGLWSKFNLCDFRPLKFTRDLFCA